MARGVEIKDKVQHLYERWARVIDNVRYIGCEHRFKEKEYGIKWRTIYYNELNNESKQLRSKYGGHLENREIENKNEEIICLVRKDWQDIKVFAKGSQFDPMMQLRENLEDYEISIGYLRMILKNIKLPE